MKNFNATLWALLVLFVFSAVAMGCNKDDDEEPTPEGPPPTGVNVVSNIDAEPGQDIAFTGTFNDENGLASINIAYADWALDKTIDLGNNPLSYDLAYNFTVPAEATPGAHTVVITANNTSNKSTTFNATVTLAEPIAFDNIYAAGGFQWWAWNAEHAYVMLQDQADPNWWEIMVHVWDGYSEIKFLGQLDWAPDNWGLVDQTNPSLGMINSEDSHGILLDGLSKNPAYYTVRFNPYDMAWTAEEVVPDIPVQSEMYIVGKGFPAYPDLDWNTEEAIPMVANPDGWGEHIFVIYELEFSDAVDMKFIGQTDGWEPIDIGFDTDYIVDEDTGVDGYQVSAPISWIPTKSGSETADLKFVNQAGKYTVVYDHFAQRAVIWLEE